MLNMHNTFKFENANNNQIIMSDELKIKTFNHKVEKSKKSYK